MGDRELLLIKHARCCTDVIRLRWRQERVNARQGVADTVHGVVNCFMHGIILGELLPIWSHMATVQSVNLRSQDSTHTFAFLPSP